MWVISPQRTKRAKELEILLPPAAVALLEQAREFRAGRVIFPGRAGDRPMNEHGMRSLLPGKGLTVHGFRASCRSGWPRSAPGPPSALRPIEVEIANVVAEEAPAINALVDIAVAAGAAMPAPSARIADLTDEASALAVIISRRHGDRSAYLALQSELPVMTPPHAVFRQS